MTYCLLGGYSKLVEKSRSNTSSDLRKTKLCVSDREIPQIIISLRTMPATHTMQSHISFCVIIKTNPRTEQHKYELSANANGDINYPIIEYENLY